MLNKVTVCFLLTLFLFPTVVSTQEIKKIPEKPFLIMAWHGPPERDTSFERYKELKDAGFTHSFSDFSDIDSMNRALSFAMENGIKLLINIPDVRKKPEFVAEYYKDHMANAGYIIIDEPHVNEFSRISSIVKKIQKHDPKHYCYINLYPTSELVQRENIVINIDT